MIYSILPVQFTCLTVFLHNSLQVLFGLSLDLATSTSYSIHFFTQSLSSFHNTRPYHRNLLAVVPRLCHIIIVRLSALYLELSFTLTSHIHHSHLCSLKCHIFFSYSPRLTSMQHTTFYTSAVQCLSLSMIYPYF